MNEKMEYKKPWGLLGNWFLILIALALCSLSIFMMWQEARTGDISSGEGNFLLRFGALMVLYGFAALIILISTAWKRDRYLAGLVGALLVAFSFLLYVPSIAYPGRSLSWINAGGFGIPCQEIGVLGYILLAAFLVEKFENQRTRGILLWTTGIVSMLALIPGRASLMVVLCCTLAFTALWANMHKQSLAILLLLGAVALAVLLFAIRSYDTFTMRGGNPAYFNQDFLRIAGWILPSAKAHTTYGPAASSLWQGATLWGWGPVQLREFLPQIRFNHVDFTVAYITSWMGKAYFWAILVLYGLLLWQVYLRADLALRQGDAFRGTIAFGVFIRYSLAALFHLGFCFQGLPSFHSYIPFLTYVGQYQFISLFELGMVCRITAKGTLRNAILARSAAKQEQKRQQEQISSDVSEPAKEEQS